jgi:hypothetical protein
MHRRSAPLLVVLVAALIALSGCGAEEPAETPGAVPFTRLDLPVDAVPVVLAGMDDALLIGVRRDGAEVVPGLLRRGPDGEVAEVAVHPAAPYGRQAEWESLATAGGRIVAVGGRRGGAHGNVRWSVWSGTDAGIDEQPQTFSTFGGLGAGDLIDAVITPAGPALVGTWQSARVGLDTAVWTPEGATWVRRSSAGTVLENSRESLRFPMAAAALRQGIAVAGWELAKAGDGSRQHPIVWHSGFGDTDWTMTRLPDAGRSAAAVAVRCWDSSCAVAGRSDGTLAVWRLHDGAWRRIEGVPDVQVPDDADLAAPAEIDGQLTAVVTRGDEVTVLRWTDGAPWTATRANGPTGQVSATATVGRTLYVLTDEGLWFADVGALG